MCAFSNDNDTVKIISGHLVIVFDDDTIIEPSYDVFCLDNIKDLMDNFNEKNKTKIDIKKLVSDHLHFTKIAEQMNNGKFLIVDKTFYNQQADYIEKLYS